MLELGKCYNTKDVHRSLGDKCMASSAYRRGSRKKSAPGMPPMSHVRPVFSDGNLRGGRILLHDLMDKSLVLQEDFNGLSASQQQLLKQSGRDEEILLPLLVKHGLITEYVAGRIMSGTT